MILLEKFSFLIPELQMRNQIVDYYNEKIKFKISKPVPDNISFSS